MHLSQSVSSTSPFIQNPVDNRKTFPKLVELAERHVHLGQRLALSIKLPFTKSRNSHGWPLSYPYRAQQASHPGFDSHVLLRSSTNFEPRYSFINGTPPLSHLVSPVILQPLDVHDFPCECSNHYDIAMYAIIVP